MKHFIEQNTNEISAIAKNSSYLTSLGLMFGSITDFMNDNIGFIGGLLGGATLGINFYFERERKKTYREYQEKDYQLKKQALKRR